jgi:hypothetical protein
MTYLRSKLAWLLGPDPGDPLARLLAAWRLWLLLALLGALAGALAFTALPPQYRARATLVVDFNLEEMLPGYEPRKTFHFLDRETRKVEEVAWSDETLSAVADRFPGLSVAELRRGKLLLSQPSDGGWHLWAQDRDPELAQQLAAAWAEIFIRSVEQAVEISGEVEQARHALAQAVYFTEPPDLEEIERLTQDLSHKSELAQGISPYVAVHLTQTAALPTQPSIPLGLYLLVGSGLFVVLAALWLLFAGRDIPSEAKSA